MSNQWRNSLQQWHLPSLLLNKPSLIKGHHFLQPGYLLAGPWNNGHITVNNTLQQIKHLPLLLNRHLQ
jgi:hypothetical protein